MSCRGCKGQGVLAVVMGGPVPAEIIAVDLEPPTVCYSLSLLYIGGRI